MFQNEPGTLELAAGSDVVLQALRRGVAERLGIGYEAVRAANPGVIYVSVTSHGLEGPLADDPGYDPLMQARSGLMSVTGDRSNAARVANRERLAGILAEHTRRFSTEALLAVLRRHQVPAAPIHTVASALADPQTAATGMLRSCEHPRIEDYVDVPMPIRWNGRRAALRRYPPEIGQHQGELFPEEP